MMLMAVYSASNGGIATPVGTPPNRIGIAMIEKFWGTLLLFGGSITLGSWMFDTKLAEVIG